MRVSDHTPRGSSRRARVVDATRVVPDRRSRKHLEIQKTNILVGRTRDSVGTVGSKLARGA